MVAPIRGVFDEAIEAGLQLPNPAARIGRFLRDRGDPAHRIDPLSVEEEARLLATARHAYPRHFPLLLCALRTGMRLGELLGLQWGDIDLHGRFIEVRRSLVEGGRIELPKNGKIRRVDLSLLLGETLETLRVRRAEETLAKGWKAVPAWVFCNEEGRPIWKSDFERRVFHKALDKAELRRIRFHDLRHTFASRLLQNQESIVYVKDQLGHHSIKVTVDVYGHLVPRGEQGGRRPPGRAGPDGPGGLRGAQPDATPAQPAALRTHARGYGLRRNPARRFGGAEGCRT